MSVPGPSSCSMGSEITNYARLGHAAQQLLPSILQELIAIKEQQHRLHTDVINNKFLTRNLRADEWIMINNARTNGYADFDIPLIYKLVRNLNLIPPPTQGWDVPNPPAQTEITTGDDIERIRRTRNSILHRGNSKVTDHELSDFFRLFKDISARLENYLGKANREFVSSFEDLETRCMDERTQQLYLDRLKDLKKNDEERSKEVDKLKQDVDNIMHKDYHKVEIEEWEEQNKLFVQTDPTEFVLKSLKESDVFTVTGSSGIGKSATVHHIALLLRDTEGYNIIPCFSPSDIETYYKTDKQLLFVFDDVCGKYTIDQADVEAWIRRAKSIRNVIQKGKVKLLVNCRLQIFQEEQFKRVEILTEKFCDLSSSKYLLADPMKLKIAYQYLPEHVVECIKNRFNEFEFIPLMFALYKSSRTADHPIDAIEFFTNPFDIYTSEMDELRLAPDKSKYCALFLLVIHNGIIEAAMFSSDESTNARHRRENIFEECGIPRNTIRKRIEEQLKSLSFLFVKSLEKTYTTIHDKVFDFLCFYFGKHLQRTLIRYADSTLIRKRTQLKSLCDAKGEFLIEVEETNEKEYFKRLILDLSLGRSEDVFNHKQMVHYEYRTKLICALKKLTEETLPSRKQILDRTLLLACYKNFCDIVIGTVDLDADVNATLCFNFWLGKLCDDSITRSDVESYIPMSVPIGVISAYSPGRDKLEGIEGGVSPLMLACTNENYEMVKYLLDKGADVNAYSTFGQSPLMIACNFNNPELIKFLIDKGANVNIANHLLRDTPLHPVCEDFNTEILNLLLDKGADVNATNNDDETPLMMACKAINDEFVQILLEKGAYINATKDNGETPLMIACNEKSLKCAQVLLDNGADVNAVCDDGNTPLIMSCKKDDNDIVELLLESGADANCTMNGETPLTITCLANNLNCIQLLLNNGANVNALSYDGSTPLMIACYSGTSDIVNCLLECGADVNAVSYDGTTPLKAACLGKRRENVQLLIEKSDGVKIIYISY